MTLTVINPATELASARLDQACVDDVFIATEG
jgi:hypothetical protein